MLPTTWGALPVSETQAYKRMIVIYLSKETSFLRIQKCKT